MESLSRTAYVDSFSNDRPDRVINLLQGRMRQAREINDQLADFFAQRAEIESDYASRLAKLRQSILSTSGSSSARNGRQSALTPSDPRSTSHSFKAIQRAVDHETSTLIRLHEAFATRCREDIEVPLRNRSTRSDWQELSKLDRNVDGYARDIEDVQQKVAKAQNKSGGSIMGGKKNSEKLPQLQSQLSSLENQWSSNLAPQYLSTYQNVDYARLNSIKEILTIFETASNDLGRERMESAERGLEAILTQWEVEQEISEWLSREGFKGGRNGSRNTTSNPVRTPNIAVESPSTNDFGMAAPRSNNIDAGGLSPSRPRAETMQSSRSQTSNGRPSSIASSSRGGREQEESGGRSKSGGLFSALKVGKLDRRKSVAPRQGLQSNNNETQERLSDASLAAGRSSEGSFSARPGSNSRERQLSTRSIASSSDDGAQNQTGRRSNRDSFMPSFFGKKRGMNAQEAIPESTSPSPLSSPQNNSTYQQQQSLNPFSAQMADERPYSMQSGDTARGASQLPDTPVTPAGERDLLGFDEDEDDDNRPLASSAVMASGAPKSPLGATAPADQSASKAGEFGKLSDVDNAPIRKDSEGYSVPPADYAKAAWESAMAGEGSRPLADDADSDDDLAQPQNLKVNIRNAPAPAASDKDALLRMKNTLLLSKPSSAGSSNSLNRRATRAGSRRETLQASNASSSRKSSSLVPSPSEEVQGQPFAGGDMTASPLGQTGNPIDHFDQSFTTARPSSPMSLASQGAGSEFGRAGSILSKSTSQQNLSASNVLMPAVSAANPFEATSSPTSPTSSSSGGLRAAILETVNVLMKGGQIVRVMITGEISLSLKEFGSASGADSGEPLAIRIRGFDTFEKSAPNLAYMTSPASSGPGEFELNTLALQAASERVTSEKGASNVVTILKYQVRLPDNDWAKYVPLAVTPQWKCEPQQTSFIITYSGAASSTFLPSTLLRDVSFTIPVSTPATNLQTKPEGSYSTSANQIKWKMDDIDLSTAAGKSAKILARFATEQGPAQPQPVSVAWKVRGQLVSRHVGIQVAGNVKLGEVVKLVQSGKYLASA